MDKIVAQNNVKKADDLLEFGYWGIEDITSNDNFYVDKKGITYIFNPGECAAFTLGEIRVFIPYEEVISVLKANSPISHLSGK